MKMTKQQLRQARKTLKLSGRKFAEELGKGDRWIRRLISNNEKHQPNEEIARKVEVLLKAHEIKQQLMKELK